MEQRSAEWHEARRGHLTGSIFKDILSGGKTAETLLYSLAAEHLTGETRPSPKAKALDWGTEHEPEALESYEFLTGAQVQSEGFILHPTEHLVGSSPDGLVGDDGMIEIKCPFTSGVHLRTFDKQEIPSEYLPQVDGNLWVLGREWCDFISYDPRMNGAANLVVIRRYRCEQAIATLAKKITAFRDKLLKLLEKCHG